MIYFYNMLHKGIFLCLIKKEFPLLSSNVDLNIRKKKQSLLNN
jgi:hypothetical protein